MWTAVIILGVLALIAVVVIGIYNRLVALRQNVNQGVADIDAQLPSGTISCLDWWKR